MSIEDLSIAVSSAVLKALAGFLGFIPSLVGGLIILIIGLIVGAVVYRVVAGVLKTLKVEKYLARYGVTSVEGREVEWTEILAELARWAIIVVFLVPTFQAWQLGSINIVLSRVILYIPNVISAVVIAMVGLVFAKLSYKISFSAARSLGKDLANTVAFIAQWSISVFVAFLVLHQLGVAQELLRILFAGVVAMLAIAGGLAFGLGGQGTAKSILESVWAKFKK